MKITKATSNQIGVINDLARQIWPIAYADILSQEQLEYMLNLFYSEKALLSQMIEKKHIFYLVQEEQFNQYVGFVSLELNCVQRKTKIHKIYVLPEVQGKGVGKLLFKEVKEIASQNNQTAIFLNVNKYNVAKHFYQSLGFTVVKEEVIDIGNGYVMDDYVMEINI